MQNIVGKRLKIIRNTIGCSQKDFANYLNVSVRSYERWEQGKSIPDILNLIKISDKLNINLDFLVGRTEVIITIVSHKDASKYFKNLK